MKTSDSMDWRHAAAVVFTPLARYFVRFVQSYESGGSAIFADYSPNERGIFPADYPGMGMTARTNCLHPRTSRPCF